MYEQIKFPMPPEVKEAFRRFTEHTTGWHVKDTNISKISVRAFSSRIKKYITSDICVGQEMDLNLSNIPHEPVLAIFESDEQPNEYLVVTPDKGKENTTVYFFEPRDVLGVERK